MNIIDSVGGALSGLGWASLGNIVMVVVVLLFVILTLGGVWFFMWYKSFNIPVKIYEPWGQDKLTEKDVEKIRAESADGKFDTALQNHIKFDNTKVKRTHARHITIKGVQYFQTFIPLKKHKPVSLRHRYDDGVHLLKLSNHVFVPIPKPKTLVEVAENTSIKVDEMHDWDAWAANAYQNANARFQDVEQQKRMTTFFVVGTVAQVLIGCFIIWMVYLSVTKGFDSGEFFSAANKIEQFADAISSGAPK